MLVADWLTRGDAEGMNVYSLIALGLDLGERD